MSDAVGSGIGMSMDGRDGMCEFDSYEYNILRLMVSMVGDDL